MQKQQRPQRVFNEDALAESGVFTSETINGEKYRRFSGKVFSDAAGSLEIQHSDPIPGTNDPGDWDTVTTIAVTGGTVEAFDEVIYCKFVRLMYTNGALAQTEFRISGYLAEWY